MRTVEAEGPQTGMDPARTTRSTRARFASPLRYPGGKAALAPFLGETIALNGLSGCAYYEPFAGGAGAALQLLRDGVVSEVHINDIDASSPSGEQCLKHRSDSRTPSCPQGSTWTSGESLAARIIELGQRAEQIHISDMDARRFLAENLPRGRQRSHVFVYLDPP